MFLTTLQVSDPIIFIIWFLLLAAGCFGTIGGLAYAKPHFGWGGGVCLFLAILLLKLFTF